MIKKTILMLLVLVGGVMSANADNPYKIVGGFTNWNYSESSWTMTQNATNTNLWYYIKKGWVATGSEIEWKVYNGSSWIPTNDNKSASFMTGNTYDLLFVFNTDDSTVKLVSSVSIQGSFNNWTGGNLAMSDDGFVFTGSIYSIEAGSTLKFHVSYNNETNDDLWAGANSDLNVTNKGYFSDAGGDQHNFAFLSNIAKGYSAFDVKAVWNPDNGHTSTASAWTVTFTPKTACEGVNYVIFTNPNNWSKVYAYSYTDNDNKETDWPGLEIAKIDGNYRYFYDHSYKYVIFNNGSSGSGNQHPVTGGFEVVSGACYNGDGQVENETATISSSGYTTFCSPCDLSFENVSNLDAAYVVSSSTSETATLKKVTAVPAGTGVILKGKPNASVTIPVEEYTGEAISNILIGTLEATTVPTETVYVVSGGQFMLYAGTSIPAKKAYLPATSISNAPSLAFDFDDDTTGIGAKLNDGVNVNIIYDLSGRRVAEPTKGIYIINGKKVILK